MATTTLYQFLDMVGTRQEFINLAILIIGVLVYLSIGTIIASSIKK